jgi:hypothetical protein
MATFVIVGYLLEATIAGVAGEVKVVVVVVVVLVEVVPFLNKVPQILVEDAFVVTYSFAFVASLDRLGRLVVEQRKIVGVEGNSLGTA